MTSINDISESASLPDSEQPSNLLFTQPTSQDYQSDLSLSDKSTNSTKSKKSTSDQKGIQEKKTKHLTTPNKPVERIIVTPSTENNHTQNSRNNEQQQAPKRSVFPRALFNRKKQRLITDFTVPKSILDIPQEFTESTSISREEDTNKPTPQIPTGPSKEMVHSAVSTHKPSRRVGQLSGQHQSSSENTAEDQCDAQVLILGSSSPGSILSDLSTNTSAGHRSPPSSPDAAVVNLSSSVKETLSIQSQWI